MEHKEEGLRTGTFLRRIEPVGASATPYVSNTLESQRRMPFWLKRLVFPHTHICNRKHFSFARLCSPSWPHQLPPLMLGLLLRNLRQQGSCGRSTVPIRTMRRQRSCRTPTTAQCQKDGLRRRTTLRKTARTRRFGARERQQETLTAQSGCLSHEPGRWSRKCPLCR